MWVCVGASLENFVFVRILFGFWISCTKRLIVVGTRRNVTLEASSHSYDNRKFLQVDMEL